MPGNFGAQLSLELTRLPRLGQVAGTAVTSVINYAGELRKSGSDIVAEADLTSLFGRTRIEDTTLNQYRDAVKDQKCVPLYSGSEINLNSGAGPTVQHALREPEYLSAIIQLSMLAYFHNRSQLATMISEAMSQRFDADVPDSIPSPGQDVIQNTLATISSQTCAFEWYHYSQEVEKRLRKLSRYHYDPGHSTLSPSTLLGAIDFLCIVQSLPEDRKVSLSSESGCIPMIIWAYFILGLTVVVTTELDKSSVFGLSESPHVYIKWCGKEPQAVGTQPPELELSGKVASYLPEPCITLHERDMTVILETHNDNSITRIRTEERHPIRCYGTTSCNAYLILIQ